MQAWYHCENVYPFVPQDVLDQAESVRASLPNRYCDPKISADLFEECLDEHLLCDELGDSEAPLQAAALLRGWIDSGLIVGAS